jgi:hypothetical protein
MLFPINRKISVYLFTIIPAMQQQPVPSARGATAAAAAAGGAYIYIYINSCLLI